MFRLLGCLLMASCARLLADGGMILVHQQSPPFVITIFASPTPPRVGEIDLSVLLQSSETLDPVLDAEVQIELAKHGAPIQVRATHDQAQNKLLYAASVPLEDPGMWRYTVSIQAAHITSKPVAISGNLAVAPEQPKLASYGGYLALPFVCLAIFALHQGLRCRHASKMVHGVTTTAL